MNQNLHYYERWNRGGKHKWITKAIAAKLPRLYANDGKDPKDVKIVLKLFNPSGAGTWYITEADLDSGIAFGYADLGLGPECSELGYIDLNELRQYKGRFGLGIERDEWFSGKTLADVMQ